MTTPQAHQDPRPSQSAVDDALDPDAADVEGHALTGENGEVVIEQMRRARRDLENDALPGPSTARYR